MYQWLFLLCPFFAHGHIDDTWDFLHVHLTTLQLTFRRKYVNASTSCAKQTSSPSSSPLPTLHHPRLPLPPHHPLRNGHHGALTPDVHRPAQIQTLDAPALDAHQLPVRIIVHQPRPAFGAEVAVHRAPARCRARVAAQRRGGRQHEAREAGADAEGGGRLPLAFEAVANVDGQGGREGGAEGGGAALAGGVHRWGWGCGAGERARGR